MARNYQRIDRNCQRIGEGGQGKIGLDRDIHRQTGWRIMVKGKQGQTGTCRDS